MASSALAPVTVDYPSFDGRPMMESDFQRIPLIYAAERLRQHFRDRNETFRTYGPRHGRLTWFVAFLLAAPLSLPSDLVAREAAQITDRLVGWGHEAPKSPRVIDTIILHSTYYASGDPYSIEGILEQFKSYGVSSHYLVALDGTIYRLVEDAHVAYHAGNGVMPDGRTQINLFSIGVEINNTRTSGPREAQYHALTELIRHLKSRYPITAILRHSDVAPGRKTDPWNLADREW